MGDVAISCQGVWKNYRIYHRRSDSLKEWVLTRANRYEEFWALKNVDLEVPVGATMGIIGANGSGKSTLLKTMARILTPNKGSIQVNGTLSSLLELGIGFHPELTGRENIFLNGSLLGQTHRQVQERYDAIVDFAGIPNFMDMPIKNYSTGMYARLAFAAAVSVEPEILIVDEVLSVGDEVFQMKCYERIAEFRTEGRTIVLVSHSLDTIRSLCADAVWIKGGEVQEVGPSHDVAASYLAAIHGSLEDNEHVSGFAGHRFGSGEAVIAGVHFLDAEGQLAGDLRTGGPLTIRVEWSAARPVEDAMITIVIFDTEKLTAVIGRDTSESGCLPTLVGAGTADLVIEDLPLLKGSYMVSVALTDPSAKGIYDFHDRRYSFMVFDNPDLPKQGGIVNLRARWQTSGGTTPMTTDGTALEEAR